MDEKLDDDTMTGEDKCSEAMLRYARANPSLKVVSEMQLVSEFKGELQSGQPCQQTNLVIGENDELMQDYVSYSKDSSGESKAIPDGQKGPEDICDIKRENISGDH